jgi:hypothetical protein
MVLKGDVHAGSSHTKQTKNQTNGIYIPLMWRIGGDKINSLSF